jgi:hypothetical protein
MADDFKEERLPALLPPITSMEAVTNLISAYTDDKMDPVTFISTLALLDLFSILNLLNSRSPYAQHEASKRQGPDPMSIIGPLMEGLQSQQGKDSGNQKFNQLAMLLPLLASQTGGGDGRKANINALLPILKLMMSQGGPQHQSPQTKEEVPEEG